MAFRLLTQFKQNMISYWAIFYASKYKGLDLGRYYATNPRNFIFS